jgi:hypothetical protein
MPNKVNFSFNLLNLLKFNFHFAIEFERFIDKFLAISESLKTTIDLMGGSNFHFYFKKVDYFGSTLSLKFVL